MTTAPRFSVVLPTHNRAHLLGRAIRSVLAQTLDDWELVIVDDASTDTTSEVLTSFDDPRVRVLHRDTAGGAAAARNLAIREARGEIIAFLDDDDAYLPRLLEETDRVYREAPPEVGFSWCGARVIEETPDGSKVRLEAVWQPRFRNRREAHRGFLLDRKVGTNGGLAVRRRCFDEVGLFDELYPRGEDTDLLVRLSEVYDFVVVPHILIEIHLHSGPRLTTYGQEMAASYERLIAKNRDFLEGDDDAWFALHYKTAWLHYHAGDRQAGRRWLRRALSRRWLRPRAWAAFLLFELLGRHAPRVHRLAYRARQHWSRPETPNP